MEILIFVQYSDNYWRQKFADPQFNVVSCVVSLLWWVIGVKFKRGIYSSLAEKVNVPLLLITKYQRPLVQVGCYALKVFY